MSKTRALANSVPTSSAVQAASPSAPLALHPAPERHQPPVPSRPAIDSRIAFSASARPSRLCPSPAPSAGGRRPSLRGDRPRPHEIAGGQPAVDQVVGDRHPDLRRLRVEEHRDRAATERRANILGCGLQGIHRLVRERGDDRSRTRRDLLGPRGELGGPWDAASALAGAALRLAQVLLERADPLRTRSTDWAPTSTATRSSVSRRSRTNRSRPARSAPRCGVARSRCSFARDHEAADRRSHDSAPPHSSKL